MHPSLYLDICLKVKFHPKEKQQKIIHLSHITLALNLHQFNDVIQAKKKKQKKPQVNCK
jgi:hypothetical protein